ncbi:MAG: glycoside hydrolase family 11 protein [Paludibacteraceae bacterium]|nr:glycoside hydrolase family 11 protein [Paludibacteraceae bacterium]
MNFNFYHTLTSLALLASTSVAGAIDPCGFAGSHSKGTVVKENSIENIGNGFNYELWQNNNSKGYMTVFGGEENCAFKAHWENSGDFIARVGYFWGKEGTSPKYAELDGDIHAEYKFTKSGTSNDYSFVGIYGWTKKPNTVEFYIVDDSFNRMTTPWNTEYVGKVTVDGATYNIYSGKRDLAPSIYDYSDFTQVFSIRQGGTRQCGHISITEHFKAWEKLGIKLGELYDCKFFIETGGYQGDIDFKYANMWIGDEDGPTPVEPREPFKELTIPGIVEAEDYDKGGQNVAYYDTDKPNRDSLYRNDRVDIVESPTGYAIGYTMAGEWTEYTVNVEETADYDIEVYMSNGGSDPVFDLSIDGDSVTSFTCKSQGDWDTYAAAMQTVRLTEGEHVLRLTVGKSYSNIDYMKFSKPTPDSHMTPAANEVVVMPNPASEFIEVKGNDIVLIELYDMLGNKIISTEHSRLDVTMLSDNTYLLRIETSDSVITRKVTIKK